MESLFLIGAVVGAVEPLKRLRLGEYWDAATIVVAAGIGALVGFFGIDGVSVTDGILGGLTASGLVTVAGKLGGPNKAESTVITNHNLNGGK